MLTENNLHSYQKACVEHIITHPFNLSKFNSLFENTVYNRPEIKHNHITLLYENIQK